MSEPSCVWPFLWAQALETQMTFVDFAGLQVMLHFQDTIRRPDLLSVTCSEKLRRDLEEALTWPIRSSLTPLGRQLFALKWLSLSSEIQEKQDFPTLHQ